MARLKDLVLQYVFFLDRICVKNLRKGFLVNKSSFARVLL